MIKSMTGYGKAETLLPDKKLTVELRSLNSKQLDTNTRLPSLYKEKEFEIRQLIASTLERGKLECSFFYELSADTTSGTINEQVVRAYFEQLSRISEELGMKASQELLSIAMRMPDAIRNDRTELEEDEWHIVKESLLAGTQAGKRFQAAGGGIP